MIANEEVVAELVVLVHLIINMGRTVVRSVGGVVRPHHHKVVGGGEQGGGDNEEDCDRRVSFNRAVVSLDASLGRATRHVNIRKRRWSRYLGRVL